MCVASNEVRYHKIGISDRKRNANKVSKCHTAYDTRYNRNATDCRDTEAVKRTTLKTLWLSAFSGSNPLPCKPFSFHRENFPMQLKQCFSLSQKKKSVMLSQKKKGICFQRKEKVLIFQKKKGLANAFFSDFFDFNSAVFRLR